MLELLVSVGFMYLDYSKVRFFTSTHEEMQTDLTVYNF
jgi:hypothetical protein